MQICVVLLSTVHMGEQTWANTTCSFCFWAFYGVWRMGWDQTQSDPAALSYWKMLCNWLNILEIVGRCLWSIRKEHESKYTENKNCALQGWVSQSFGTQWYPWCQFSRRFPQGGKEWKTFGLYWNIHIFMVYISWNFEAVLLDMDIIWNRVM